MSTLVSKDTSGTFTAGAGETEIVSARTRAFKKFSLGNNQYRVGGQVGPIHYKVDPFSTSEQYSEIDLDVTLTPDEDWDAACESNGYQVRFWQNVTRGTKTFRYAAQFRRATRWLAMAPLALVYENNSGQRQLISAVVSGITPVIDNDAHTVTWENAFGTGLHFRYNLQPDKFFKTLVISAKANLPTPTIGANGRRLALVMALEWDAGAATRNGFASSVTTAFNDDYTGAADETAADPDLYDHYDGRGSLWWVQRPMAWDSSEDVQSVPVVWRLARRGTGVYAAFTVTTAALNAAGVTYPVYVDTAISEEQTGASTDDGRTAGTTWPGEGTALLNGTNIRMGAAPTAFYGFGARFTTVPIPNAATINTASVSLILATTSDISLDVALYAHDNDDSATFANTTNTETGGPGYRTRTTATVRWNVGGTSWSANTWYASPDISTVIAEVVARGGWASDNDLSVLINNYSTSLPGSNTYRAPDAYDATGNVRGPKFNCTYTAAAAGVIKKISGVPIAGVKKVSGVAIAGVKKVSGVSNV